MFKQQNIRTFFFKTSIGERERKKTVREKSNVPIP